MHVRLFQCTGPTDVGLLVATGLDLDQRNDLLAAFSGADQRADDGAGRTRRPVQRLLDGENVGVAGSVIDERLHGRRERVIRVVRKDIASAQDREQVRHFGRDAAKARLRRRRPDLFFEVRTVELRQNREAAHVEEAVDQVHVRRLELELARQQVEHLRGHARINLEADDSRVAAPASQLGLDRRQQVFRIAVDIVQIAITRHAERMMGDDLHARKEQRKMQRDHVFQWHVALALDQRDEARQDGRHLDPREPLLPSLRIANHHSEVQR